MDLAKIVYAFIITRDKELPGCIVRNTTIPEELGRIAYLMCDKTGTLTKNEMVFKKLHLGTIAFSSGSMDEVREELQRHFSSMVIGDGTGGRSKQVRQTGTERLADAVLAIAVCHNVTPMLDDDKSAATEERRMTSKNPVEWVSRISSIANNLLVFSVLGCGGGDDR